MVMLVLFYALLNFFDLPVDYFSEPVKLLLRVLAYYVYFLTFKMVIVRFLVLKTQFQARIS